MISKTTRWLYTALAFILAPAIAFAQPANDLCAGAIPITFINSQGSCAAAGPTTLAFTSDGTTDSGVPTACSNPGLDQWFTWTATSPGLNWDQQNPGGPGIAVFASCADAATGTSIDCRNTLSDGTLSGWAIGDNLIIQIYDFNGSVSDVAFCLEEYTPPPPPANDLCVNATPVQVGNLTCGPTVTATNASATGTAGDVCGSTSTVYGDGDIWFSFEAGGPTAVLDLSTTVGSMYISVYDECGGSCVYNNNFISTSTNEIITGLTASETYLIRMYESGNNSTGTIEFCMFTPPPPPVNDVCGGAIPAVVGANGTCPAGAGAYSEDFSQVNNTTEFASCDLTGNYDLWYTWVATAASIEFTDGTGDPGMAVYSGSCGSLTELGCLNNVSGTIGGLVIGQTYYLQVWDDTQGISTVEWCWQAGPACGDPTSLAVGNVAQFSADVTFNAIAAGGHTVEYGPTGFTPGTGTTVAVPSGGAVTLSGLSGMTSYDVYVSADCGSAVAGPVSFTTLGPPPPNDLCSSATPVTLGTGTCGPTVMTDNTNATGIAGDVCNSTSTSYGGADIWFSFVATGTSAFLDLISEPGGGTAASMYISVYDACGGNCVYNNNFVSTTTIEEITGLTSGNTYYIRMYDFGANDFGAFEFCMFGPGAPPANDLCSAATPVTLGTGTCGPTITATNAFATGVAGDVCGSTSTSYGDGDIWFSFVAGTSSAYLDLISTVGSMYISVYDACGGACVYNNNFISTSTIEEITGLTPGNTYYIRMYESGNNAIGTIEFCMFNAGSPPVNDLCSGATPVTLGSGTCGPTVTATNAFATGVAGDVCGSTSTSYGDGDIWYSFVAGSATVYLDMISTVGSMYLSVYDACGGACVYNNNFLSTFTDEEIGSLTPGNTYYIRMYESGNNAIGSFDFCMYNAAPPPVNDACGNAIAIAPLVSATGTTSFATNVESLSPCSGGGGGGACTAGGTGTIDFTDGVWYVYTSTQAEDITVSTDNPGTDFDTEIQVWSGTCGALTCIGGDDDGGSVFLSSSSVFCFSSTASFSGGGSGSSSRAAPVDYYIYIDGHAANSGNFELTLTANSVPLPVELASFNAYATSEGNVVEWTAATEVDFYMYTVERALDPASFTALAEVAPKGTTYAEAVYTSQDLNPATVTYYRLRMEDLDGTVEYSDVVAVTRDDISGGINMFPNPAKEHVTFEVLTGVSDNGTVDVVLTDLNGRTIREWNLATGQRTSVSLSGIPSGVYMVSSVSAAGTASQRLVID